MVHVYYVFLLTFLHFKGTVVAHGQVDSTSILICISNTPFPYGFRYFLFKVGNNTCIHQETIVLSQTCAL